MFLVVGLGNPGPKYASHRHNVGFMVVDELARRWGASSMKEKFKASFTKVVHGGEDVVLLEPQTFMNRSGEAVQAAMQFFKVPLERVLVVHDELDLPFGALRIKVGGGAAGHNGLKSVTQRCGGSGFLRLRVGIGRPPAGTQQTVSWVLSDFSALERAELPDRIAEAADAVETVISRGPEEAMNRHHRRP